MVILGDWKLENIEKSRRKKKWIAREKENRKRRTRCVETYFTLHLMIIIGRTKIVIKIESKENLCFLFMANKNVTPSVLLFMPHLVHIEIFCPTKHKGKISVKLRKTIKLQSKI